MATPKTIIKTGNNIKVLTEIDLIAFKNIARKYSVNSGNVDANGYADLINKIDESSIDYKIGGAFPSITSTFPNGDSLIHTGFPSTTGIVDGRYVQIIEQENPTVMLQVTNTITEDIIPHASPVDGDYWLNIGVNPHIPYKRVGGAWVVTQFVKIGEIEKTGGVIATPITYAFNGKYSSALFSITINNTYIVNHNIGSVNVNAILQYRESPAFEWEDIPSFISTDLSQIRGITNTFDDVTTTVKTGTQALTPAFATNAHNVTATVGEVIMRVNRNF